MKPHIVQSSLIYFLIFVTIGIPIWWKSTSIYQASLPCEDISTLSPFKVGLPITVEIMVHDSHNEKLDYSDAYLKPIESNLNTHPRTYSNITFNWRLSVDKTSNSHLSALNSIKYQPSWRTDQEMIDNFEALDSKLEIESNDSQKVFSKQILIFSKVSHLNVPYKLYMGKFRRLFVAHTGDRLTVELAKAIAEILNEQVNDFSLASQSINQETLDIKSAEVSKRAFPTSAKFEILTSLVIGGSRDKNYILDDSVEDVIGHLTTFLSNLSKFAQFTMSAQTIYHAILTIKPQYNEERKSYVIYNHQLEHFVNTVDWNLGSNLHNYPIINLLVFFPPPDMTPLIILDKSGKPLESNAFLIPRWGGVQIVNSLLSENSTSTTVTLTNEQRNMIETLFISQMRLLLGLSATCPVQGNYLSPLELDYLMENRYIENLVTSAHALQSVCELVGSIRNMAISEKLKTLIVDAMDAFKLGQASLLEGRWEQGFELSKTAFEKSEIAFFDKNVLSLLYFPEENKYAVYIPLFVPVCLPVLVGFLKLFQRKKQNEIK